MFKNKINKLKCNKCSYKNPILYKKCRKCGNLLINKNSSYNNGNSDLMKNRFDRLSKIQSELKFAEKGMSLLSDDILSFSQKCRWMFEITKNILDNDDNCIDLYNMLVVYGKMDNNDNEDINEDTILESIIDKINQLYEQIETTNNENYAEGFVEYKIMMHNQINNSDNNNSYDEYDEYDEYNEYNECDEYDDYDDYDDYYDYYDDYTKIPNPLSDDQMKLIISVNEGLIPDNDDDNCAICVEKLKQVNIIVLKLPCGHMYHKECILPWFKDNCICPLGRCPITSLHGLIEQKK